MFDSVKEASSILNKCELCGIQIEGDRGEHIRSNHTIEEYISYHANQLIVEILADDIRGDI